MGNGLVVLFAVALLDVLFACAVKVLGPLEPDAFHAGLFGLTVMGAIASTLAVRSNARGGWVVALVVPATLAATWCVAMTFALTGSMHFIRWAGLWTRGTDMAWFTRLTLVGVFGGLVFGTVLALALRDRAWTFATAALAGAVSIPVLGWSGMVLAAFAQVVLGIVALRDARAMRVAETEWHHGKQLEAARTNGGPYRLPESAPLERLARILRASRIRAWGASSAMLVVTIVAAIITTH